jgi:hypothetical protein
MVTSGVGRCRGERVRGGIKVRASSGSSTEETIGWSDAVVVDVGAQSKHSSLPAPAAALVELLIS